MFTVVSNLRGYSPGSPPWAQSLSCFESGLLHSSHITPELLSQYTEYVFPQGGLACYFSGMSLPLTFFTYLFNYPFISNAFLDYLI